MKKLTLSLALVLVLVGGTYTPVFACGHQHAEKCLVSSTDDTDKSKVIKLQKAILIYWANLIQKGLPW